MKTMIVYSSQTGNTKKLADAVNDSLTGDTELYPITEAPAAQSYDLVVLGFWLKAGKPDPAASEYLAKVGDTNLFLFATHGAAAGSEHALNAMEYAKSLVPSATVLGTFSCQGEVNPKVLEKVRAKTPMPPWLDDAKTAVGHPDQQDLETLCNSIKSLNLS